MDWIAFIHLYSFHLMVAYLVIIIAGWIVLLERDRRDSKWKWKGNGRVIFLLMIYITSYTLVPLFIGVLVGRGAL